MKLLIPSFILIASTSCQLATSYSNADPVAVTTPESKASNFETNDSSFLQLKIKEDKFEIDFLKKVSVFNSMDELDAFLQKNQNRINKSKVVITHFDTTNNSLVTLLAKFGITRFSINNDEKH